MEVTHYDYISTNFSSMHLFLYHVHTNTLSRLRIEGVGEESEGINKSYRKE